MHNQLFHVHHAQLYCVNQLVEKQDWQKDVHSEEKLIKQSEKCHSLHLIDIFYQISYSYAELIVFEHKQLLEECSLLGNNS